MTRCSRYTFTTTQYNCTQTTQLEFRLNTKNYIRTTIGDTHKTILTMQVLISARESGKNGIVAENQAYTNKIVAFRDRCHSLCAYNYTVCHSVIVSIYYLVTRV